MLSNLCLLTMRTTPCSTFHSPSLGIKKYAPARLVVGDILVGLIASSLIAHPPKED
jgi:hypothetical protein